jgi:hypothetical protein
MSEKQSYLNELGGRNSVSVKELLELLEEYNKYMEQVNELYDVSSNGIIIIPSTTSVPTP